MGALGLSDAIALSERAGNCRTILPHLSLLLDAVMQEDFLFVDLRIEQL